MNATSLIRQEMATAHEWFEATVADVDEDLAHWVPGGTAHPIGSRYAHMVVAEDMLVQGVLRESPTLFASSWAGKTGVPDPQQAFDTSLEWAQTVRVDLGALRSYAQAVYAATDAYLAALTDEDLDSAVDMSAQGYGQFVLGNFFLSYVLGHTRDIMGEISAIKGLKGQQGYPF